MKLGITLPSFVKDPGIPLAVARTAEDAGLDGVFVFDHLFRLARDGSRRPALEGTTLLGAVAAETSTITVGTLVARATLRPAAVLATALETAMRIAPGRVVVGIGAGDSESRAENEAFGLPFGTFEERLAALTQTVVAVRARGVPVWVGGHVAPVRTLAAAEADGWNRWGGGVERFATDVAELRAAAVHTPFACTWSGLAAFDTDDARADEKARRLHAGPDVLVGGPERLACQLRAYASAGADWAVVGPLDSTDPANARLLGDAVLPRLSSGVH